MFGHTNQEVTKAITVLKPTYERTCLIHFVNNFTVQCNLTPLILLDKWEMKKKTIH